MTPKLSIIVPVYNVEAYVGQCLQSVLDTEVDSSSYEIIVVNDGTKDNSMQIVLTICDGRDNVQIIEQENQGLSAARMKGMSYARGEYIWFIDSDDWVSPNAVSEVLCILSSDSIDAIVTPLNVCFPDSRQNYSDIVTGNNLRISAKDYLKSGKYSLSSSVKYIFKYDRTDKNMTFFPEGLLHEDEYFGRVLLYQLNDILVLDHPIYNYRQRENSIMRSISIRSAYDIVQIHKLLIDFMNRKVSFSDKEWFRKRSFEVLILSYCLCGPIFKTPEFKRFLSKNKNYIFSEYNKISTGLSIRRIFGDRLFIRHPVIFHAIAKNVRYIEFKG